MSTFSDRRAAAATIDILPPEKGAGTAKIIHFRRVAEIEEAQFTPVHDAATPRARPVSSDRKRAMQQASAAAAPGAFARFVQLAEAKLMRLSPDAFVALLAALIVGVFTLCGGFSLIPGTAAAEPGPALDITHVTMTPQDANGMRILLINGIVENRTGDRHAMPQVRAELLAGETVVATTLITTAPSHIGGGQSFGFSARVPHPGGKLPDLRLSLTERGV